ncbi:hypothetical protein Tdes44962_MAKER00306 [Teratosphaeria destructans]|uniref:Cyanovirin-N domain-containing protein n=1 Tax=Teratosphaeria destructans TaxID=418781 RepID=A0A9W7SVP7_9PEZI|nr:hypothetical protein Tdes44962_MAKER00306 [Teratosphaeria destructans]
MARWRRILPLLLFATTTLACASYKRCRCYNTKDNVLNFTLTDLVCLGTRADVFFLDNDGCHTNVYDHGFRNCHWRSACNQQFGVADFTTSHHFVDYCDDKLDKFDVSGLDPYTPWTGPVTVHSGRGHWVRGKWVDDP